MSEVFKDTTVKDFKNHFLNDTEMLSVIDTNGYALSDDAYVVDGCKVQLISISDGTTILDELTIRVSEEVTETDPPTTDPDNPIDPDNPGTDPNNPDNDSYATDFIDSIADKVGVTSDQLLMIAGCSNMEDRMYRKDKEGKKERREDIKQLWKSLHSDNECFSENIEWFGRKAIDSEAHRSLEIMFATYLSIMIKVDNRLFLGRTYWDIKSRRVDRVYRLLMSCGYAERIMELALGAANLYAQTKHKGYSGKTTELREIAEWYKLKVEQHRQKYDGDRVSRQAGWNMIRISNRVFAKIYDIVEDGTISGGWKINTYFKSLEEPTDRDQLHNLYMDTFERLLNPRKYRWKKFLNKFKLPIRNKRKKIDWTKI